MKIAFLGLSVEEIAYFKQEMKDEEVVLKKENIEEVDINEIKNSDILCINAFQKINCEVLSEFTNLKMIATRSTGMDHISLEDCKYQNIIVKNVPLYGDNTIAEFAFSLLLTISRKMIKTSSRIKEGSVYRGDLQGFDLEAKTIGLIGGGNIGINVVKMAKGFGMNVIVYDIHQDKELEKKYGFSYVSLDELYEKADIISLHVPYNKHTYHMLNDESFHKMKSGVVIINTARGEVVDTDALIRALEYGKVSACGLDVFEGEAVFAEDTNEVLEEKKRKRLSDISKLLSYENVIITPHNAYNTKEAVYRINATTANNIREIL